MSKADRLPTAHCGLGFYFSLPVKAERACPFIARVQRGPSIFFYVPFSYPRELPDYPSLRASDEHSFLVRVLRARRMVWWLPIPFSEAARCSTTAHLTSPEDLAHEPSTAHVGRGPSEGARPVSKKDHASGPQSPVCPL